MKGARLSFVNIGHIAANAENTTKPGNSRRKRHKKTSPHKQETGRPQADRKGQPSLSETPNKIKR